MKYQAQKYSRPVILNTDSYKCSHAWQYPSNLEYLSSYIEARAGAYPFAQFFGLQGILKSGYFDPFTQADLDFAADFVPAHIPGLKFNYDGWKHILEHHNGVLPIRIDAVREGTKVPTGNVLVQISNTDPKLPWLPQFVETTLLRGIWYPTTVSTRSKFIKETFIRPALEKTSEAVEPQINFKLHDFGFRGVSSYESAEIGGAAHLVNFMGTDTMAAILYVMSWYGAESMPAFSIPAAEHSTIMAWGKDSEALAYENMVSTFGGAGKMFAVVSDTYDIYSAVKDIWGDGLFDQVCNNGGTLVIRPDSGKPHVPAEILNLLGDAFGYTVNKKGYRVLPDYLRVIHGDSVNEKTIPQIYDIMMDGAHGWSADNIAFGMGGELLQTVNRDTLGFAQKASAIRSVGEAHWTGIKKTPVGDPGKNSKAGRLALVKGVSERFQTVQEHSLAPGERNYLEKVWENGVLFRDQTFDEIRQLSNVP